ncbi:unnamed protein product [Peronospora belbahrii]|uniref:glucose-6-phosphate 1-epimerase n=1 Tax=Peronospora belbahrii TaxID=622444 RepID=A0AAU9L4T3_9STRA|nr:unnamed protein product [Peronospora belbahrii]CAH0522403.1 unnamed protein product [Peronospora belbahrii]
MSATNKSVIELRHPSGSHAQVHLYGATVTSFYTAQEPERNVLFLSKRAILDGSQCIRGGIPLVFPVFGAVEGFPNHGFARTQYWKLNQLDETVDDDDVESPIRATFSLDISDDIKALYPHKFTLEYEVKLFANALTTSIHIQNKSEWEISFQALLHTYLSADDVRHEGVAVEGLKGLTYYDKVTKEEKTEHRDAITFSQETDSVYANAQSPLVVRIKRVDGKEQVVTIEKEAFIKSGSSHVSQSSDIVVWNPWVGKAKSMSDFGDDEYLAMLCVEPGRVIKEQKLPVGHTYTLQQTIKLSAL